MAIAGMFRGAKGTSNFATTSHGSCTSSHDTAWLGTKKAFFLSAFNSCYWCSTQIVMRVYVILLKVD